MLTLNQSDGSSTINPSTASRIVAYIRGSTEEQRLTLDAQLATIKGYCTFKGLALDRVFIDSGTSAYKLPFRDRDVAKQLLEYAENNGIRQIAFAKLDRSFRNTRDCLAVVDSFVQSGIRLHFLDLQVDTSTSMGRFFLTVLAAIAELENGIRSERQRAAFAVMRSSGQRRGAIPYGWMTVPSSSRVSRTGRSAEDLVPNLEEQEVLRTILAIRERGIGYLAIACFLNESGVPSKKGGKWHASTVESVSKHAVLADVTDKEPHPSL